MISPTTHISKIVNKYGVRSWKEKKIPIDNSILSTLSNPMEITLSWHKFNLGGTIKFLKIKPQHIFIADMGMAYQWWIWRLCLYCYNCLKLFWICLWWFCTSGRSYQVWYCSYSIWSQRQIYLPGISLAMYTWFSKTCFNWWRSWWWSTHLTLCHCKRSKRCLNVHL